MSSPPDVRREVTVTLLNGLHLRPASLIARRVTASGCTVRIVNGEKSADAASVLDLIALNAGHGTRLILESSGEGSEGVLDSIVPYFEKEDSVEPDEA